jgi:hypothetical protein
MADPGEGVMNNSSLLAADRATHVKIVVLSLIFATLVAGVGIAARVSDGKFGLGRYEAAVPVIKAAKPVTASKASDTLVR